jgi:hypothetical protein
VCLVDAAELLGLEQLPHLQHVLEAEPIALGDDLLRLLVQGRKRGDVDLPGAGELVVELFAERF